MEIDMRPMASGRNTARVARPASRRPRMRTRANACKVLIELPMPAPQLLGHGISNEDGVCRVHESGGAALPDCTVTDVLSRHRRRVHDQRVTRHFEHVLQLVGEDDQRLCTLLRFCQEHLYVANAARRRAERCLPSDCPWHCHDAYVNHQIGPLDFPYQPPECQRTARAGIQQPSKNGVVGADARQCSLPAWTRCTCAWRIRWAGDVCRWWRGPDALV